jgi:hypothetical protein
MFGLNYLEVFLLLLGCWILSPIAIVVISIVLIAMKRGLKRNGTTEPTSDGTTRKEDGHA